MVLPAPWRRACAVLLLFTLQPAWSETRASAATPASAQQAAFSLFHESEVRFRAGDFIGAAALLRKAHALYPEPTLLYNLGRALEGMGDLGGAIDSYTQYLGEEQKLIDRGAIERQIATLRSQLDERQTLTAQREEADRARREADVARREAERQLSMASSGGPRSRASLAAPWILASVGVLGLAIGGGLGGAGLSRHDAAVDAANERDAANLQGEAHNLAIGADVAFAVGGALAFAGVVWGIVDVRHRRAARRAAETTP